jgi:nicotinamide-nucleotide amidase
MTSKTVTPAERVHVLLRERQATVATAESLTGGRLAVLLTTVPGSSTTFVGGVVSYATSMKIGVLGVPEQVVTDHGVVSAECAVAMARGVRSLSGATYGVSTTGVAGPAEQEGHPAGTVFVGLAGPDGVSAVSLELVGDRGRIQDRTCTEALAALAGVVGQEETGLR